MIYNPYEYQKRATQKILDTPYVGLFLGMGLGKTSVTLTAVNELIYQRFEIARVLVVAPLAVAQDTWGRESEKWDHLKHLKIAKILGSAKKRQMAAASDADVYVINRENLTWLVNLYRHSWRWDMVVLDELSSFKSNTSERFKSFKKVRPLISRVVGLTGTPTPKGLMDLWAEMFCLDRGERLGRTLGSYRAQYFKPGRRNGYTVFDWIPNQGAFDTVTKKISDITVAMQTKDYLELPELINNKIFVTLPDQAKKRYRELEKKCFLEFPEDKTVTAASAATVLGKLLQISGGAVYDDTGGYVEIHDEKLKTLEDLIDVTDEPIFCLYGYRHERERLFKRFAKLNPREIHSPEDIADWNAGKIRLLIAHPASVGFGLNLQEGGRTIVWYSLPWSLELYQQANARLYRQGQTRSCIIHHIITSGTADEDVLQRLIAKDTSQQALLDVLSEARARSKRSI